MKTRDYRYGRTNSTRLWTAACTLANGLGVGSSRLAPLEIRLPVNTLRAISVLHRFVVLSLLLQTGGGRLSRGGYFVLDHAPARG